MHSSRNKALLITIAVLLAVIGIFVAYRQNAHAPIQEEPVDSSLGAATSTEPVATSAAPSASPTFATHTVADYPISFRYPASFTLVTAAENASGSKKFVRSLPSGNSTKLVELDSSTGEGMDMILAFITLAGTTTPAQKLFSAEGKAELAQTYTNFNAQLLSTEEIAIGGLRALRYTVKVPGTTLVDVYVPYKASGILQLRYAPASADLAAIAASVRIGE